MPLMEFHIARDARQRYGVRDTLFSFSGNVVFADVAGSRDLAHRMNQARGAETAPERVVNPGALFAMGLIDEASHLLIEHYRKTVDPAVMRDALAWFQGQLGPEMLQKLLLAFVEEFPGTPVYRGEQTADEWLRGETDGVSHREVALEELMLLWLANANTAFKPFQELFDDQPLAETTRYKDMSAGLRPFFATKPPIGPDKLNLFDLLRAPALASPDSLSGQLAFIREKWAPIVGGDALRRLLLAIDVLQEEEIAIWMRFHPPSEAERLAEEERRRRGHWGFQPGRVDLPDFAVAQHEYERFSQDTDWMPTTVMIAKSTYVWLHQLSRQYGRSITRLDQIPDEELDSLAYRGMNALWLIGLWERSRASRTIKRLCGKEDAVASAYSLYDYVIAPDLGGEEAYRNLRDRARSRGIRLASDMVPNHMGIDSTWVIQHPEWFLSRPDSPYPAYSFEGPDLSSDGRVEIKIEDHYYTQSDAAVVFRRRDKWTGDTRYVYHGNDGTSFPWNDTAQLDYLNPAVREQVIQTILQVARQFPIIRFDAAMTLAKRHIQRLWFPAPGAGGAIPSRAEYSMPTSEFDARIPVEFWREVVDRVAAEVPGTLLLAEAFWMMEGYFVRTLGMHRVYNSAFMNLLRDEDNAHYRSLLKNTMEFDPGIMKRYVNFMSNPDERTAIDQFGTGDKYFGIATMMATLPGLPMFGHGQVEGFTEKYGMEFYKPRYEETPNQWLVDRHQREIAPLLYQRALFAESDNFLLYDFWTEHGTVDENVYAYSNRRGGQRALVLYHNRYGTTRGTVHHSSAYADKAAGGLRQRALHEGLDLPNDPSVFLAYRDVSTGLEYLRRSSDVVERGFFIELQAYKYHVLLNWREYRASAEQPWDRLHDMLGGSGVPSLEEAFVNLRLQPVHDALKALLAPSLVRRVAEVAEHRDPGKDGVPGKSVRRAAEQETEALTEDLTAKAYGFVEEAQGSLARYFGRTRDRAWDREGMHEAVRTCVRAVMELPQLEASLPERWPEEARAVLPSGSPRRDASAVWGPVLGWCAVHALTDILEARGADAIGVFDQLRLRHGLAQAFATLGLEGEDAWRAAARVRVLLERQGRKAVASAGAPRVALSADDWKDGDVRWLAGVHDAEGRSYLVKEPYERLVWWLLLPALLEHTQQGSSKTTPALQALFDQARAAEKAAAAAGYRLDRLLDNLAPTPSHAPSSEHPSQVEILEQALAPASTTDLAQAAVLKSGRKASAAKPAKKAAKSAATAKTAAVKAPRGGKKTTPAATAGENGASARSVPASAKGRKRVAETAPEEQPTTPAPQSKRKPTGGKKTGK